MSLSSSFWERGLPVRDMSTRVDLVWGDAGAGTLKVVFPDARVLALRDDLSVGPHGPRYDAGARSRWWGSWSVEFHGRDRAIADHVWARIASDACVWFGGGVGEQLHLCWAAHHLELEGFGSMNIALIPDTAAGFMIASRSPANIEAGLLFRLPPRIFARAAELWRAFCEPTPTRFAELAYEAMRAGALTTLLLGSLQLLLLRLPDPADGLDYWDRILLERVAAHPWEGAARTVGHVIGRAMVETADHMGDLTLLLRLKRLVAAGCSRQRGLGLEMRGTSFALSTRGEQVLRGEVNRAELESFERWLGGTRVSAAASWWFDGRQLRRSRR